MSRSRSDDGGHKRGIFKPNVRLDTSQIRDRRGEKGIGMIRHAPGSGGVGLKRKPEQSIKPNRLRRRKKRG